MPMVLLVDAIEDKKMDVRMIERNLSRGLLTPEDVEKAAKKIQDDAENATWISPETLTDDA